MNRSYISNCIFIIFSTTLFTETFARRLYTSRALVESDSEILVSTNVFEISYPIPKKATRDIRSLSEGNRTLNYHFQLFFFLHLSTSAELCQKSLHFIVKSFKLDRTFNIASNQPNQPILQQLRVGGEK